MNIGLLGKKCGMTRVFTEDGASIPVTVIEVLPNRVTQIKTLENDGYQAVQVTMGNRRRSRVNKAAAGHFAKAGVEPGCALHEFAVQDIKELEGLNPGAELKVDRFEVGQYVDVTGTTKGKGYAGVVKRHHFRTQDMSHGNSVSHRAPGSIGQRQSPGRVFKNKRMSGHMGDVQRTVLSQQVVRIDEGRNLIMIKGAVPGAENGLVVIRSAVKKLHKKSA